jgi:hypothetical protein
MTYTTSAKHVLPFVSPEDSVFVFIHAAILPRCKSRIMQYYNHFAQSGAISLVDHIFISFVGDDQSLPIDPYVDLMAAEHFPKIHLVRTSPDLLDYELPTLSLLHDFATASAAVLSKPAKILYLHTKSIHGDINPCIEDQVEYMCHFLIDNAKVCIDYLNAFSTAGVDLRPEPVLHFSGNFWWATAKHVSQLPPPTAFADLSRFPNPLNSARHNQEFWICHNSQPSIHKCLWDCGISCYGRHLERYPRDIYRNKPHLINKTTKTFSKYFFCNTHISTIDGEIHSLAKYKNVISYTYGFNDPSIALEIIDSREIDYNSVSPRVSAENAAAADNISTTYYFVFDNQGQDALAHWIYESFVFYPIFLRIQETHPSIKILTTNRKKYVRNMLDLVGISAEIVYAIPPPTTSTANVCFFPPIVGINEDVNLDVPLISRYLHAYIAHMQNVLFDFGKKTRLLYLPRNTKDNFAYNFVEIKGQDELESAVIENGGTVLNTFQLNNIYLQFLTLHNAKHIMLDFGSSSLFNLPFLKGKTIFILDNRGWFDYHYERFEFNRIHHDIICKHNTVHVIRPNQDTGAIAFRDIAMFL